MSAAILLAGFAFGMGFGYFVQRAGLCFAYGLGELFSGRGRRILRMFNAIFIITALGFLVSGWINPELGLKAVGQIRGAGFYNVLSGIIFGAGITLNGGCILGTLRQIGEGNMLFALVLLSFIPGMAAVVYGMDALLGGVYNAQALILPDITGLPKTAATLALVSGSAVWLYFLYRTKD